MEALSESAREMSGTDGLWQYLPDREAEPRTLEPRRNLNTLTRFAGEPQDSLVLAWHFTAHQFRRFFAVIYFWRYEPGDVAALSHHLRHFDLEMTKRYVTGNANLKNIWDDVHEEWKGAFLQDVIDGSRTIAGSAGERVNKLIRKLKAQYRRDVEVVPTERIVKRLLRLARKWGVSCTLHVWGTICICPRKHNARFGKLAHCKGASETGPDFDRASEETCATCPFAVHTEQFAGAARAALAAREQIPTGLSDGALITNFVASSCERLDRALETGDPAHMPPRHGTREG